MILNKTLPQTAEEILNNPLNGESETYYQERFKYNPLWDNNNILNNLDNVDSIEILNLLSGLFSIPVSKIEICNDFECFAIGFLLKKLPSKRQISILKDFGLTINFKFVPYFGIHFIIREAE